MVKFIFWFWSVYPFALIDAIITIAIQVPPIASHVWYPCDKPVKNKLSISALSLTGPSGDIIPFIIKTIKANNSAGVKNCPT